MPKYEQTKTILQKLVFLLMKFEEKISYFKTNL